MPKPKPSKQSKDELGEAYPPTWTTASEVAMLEEGAMKFHENRGLDRLKLTRRAKCLPLFRPGVDNEYTHRAARVLFFASRYRRAVKDGLPDAIAYFALRVGRAAEQMLEMDRNRLAAQFAHYHGTQRRRTIYRAIWDLVSEHLKGRNERPTAAMLYRTLKIEATYTLSLKRFQGILTEHDWRKVSSKVSK